MHVSRVGASASARECAAFWCLVRDLKHMFPTPSCASLCEGWSQMPFCDWADSARGQPRSLKERWAHAACSDQACVADAVAKAGGDPASVRAHLGIRTNTRLEPCLSQASRVKRSAMRTRAAAVTLSVPKRRRIVSKAASLHPSYLDAGYVARRGAGLSAKGDAPTTVKAACGGGSGGTACGAGGGPNDSRTSTCDGPKARKRPEAAAANAAGVNGRNSRIGSVKPARSQPGDAGDSAMDATGDNRERSCMSGIGAQPAMSQPPASRDCSKCGRVGCPGMQNPDQFVWFD